MKYYLAFCISFLIAVAATAYLPSSDEAKIYSSTLRLHVIANSDSEEDQSLKLSVRDCVLEYITELTRGAESRDEAELLISPHIDEIEKLAEGKMLALGYGYGARAELTTEAYPRRDYGDTVIPAGKYHSLKIILGEGEGENWWCVLFPSMCTGYAMKSENEFVAAGFTPAEYRLISKNNQSDGDGGKYKVKFRILEILSEIILSFDEIIQKNF